MIGDFADNAYFLRYWDSYKACLAAPFGDKLILKRHVKFPVPEEEREKEMSNLVFNPTLGGQLRDSIESFLRDEMTGDFYHLSIQYRGLTFYIYELFSYYVFTCQAFNKNIYEGPTFGIELKGGKWIKFVEGMKLMKLLKRLSDAAGVNDLFEKVRISQSMILNDNNLDAEICLSINPIDFMTASFNNNAWSSCMDWTGGEYRRGVIEMMNSSYVVVAYINSDKNTILGGDWGSKRWREFFIVSRDMISGIKGYPYWNRDLEDFVISWLQELYEPVFGVFYDYKSNWSPDYDDNMRIVCGPAMYNDFYGCNEYHSIFSDPVTERFVLDYSGPSECVICGEVGYFEDEGCLYCTNCVEAYYCVDCGCLITDSDNLVEHDGNYYCASCYDALPRCDYCDEKVGYESYENFYICMTDLSKNIVENNKYYPTPSFVVPICDEWGCPRIFYIDDDCMSEVIKEDRSSSSHWFNDTNFYGHYIEIRNFKKSALLEMVGEEELQRCYKELNEKIKKSC